MSAASELDFRDSRVLVTGGAGFIGNRLCARLTELGANVVNVSRTAKSTVAGVHSISQDLLDLQATRQTLDAQRPDYVFHLASHVVGTRSLDAVIPTFTSNLASTVNLLVAASEIDCRRVILTGSMEEPEPTNDWSIPSSPYAAAKAAAASYGRMFNALFDLPTTILRVFMVYGPGQLDHRKLVPYVITSLLDGAEPRLMSGTREVDWIYVDDVVEAYVAAATAPGLSGQTIDVGSGKLATVRSVVEALYKALGQDRIPGFGDVADRPMEQTRKANLERTTQLLGWKPVTTLSQGLAKTVAWYASHRSGPGIAGSRS